MDTERQKLGVLVIGRKRPGWDQEWSATIRKTALGSLASLGFDCIGAESPVIDDQTIAAALDRIHQDKCKALVVLQPSLGHGQLAFAVMQGWDGPVVLWATPERQDVEKVSSCSLVAQHLWAATLRQSNHPFEFVYGHPDDATVRASLQQAIGLSQAATSLRTMKIGMVGSHAPGFVSMQADPFTLRRELGVQLHDLSLPLFIDRVRGIDERAVRDDIAKTRSLKINTRGALDDDLAVQSRYYLAMLDLMKEEALDGMSLQDWPELPNVIGQWPYLAMSRLADEGQAVAMEGDVDSAILTLLGKQIGAGVSFITDWLEHDDQTIHMWHAGTAPLGMLENAALGPHFNIDKPLVVNGALKVDQPVTLARLWRCDDRYHATAFEGRTIPLKRKLSGNQALIQVDGGGVYNWFDTLCHAGMPHHPVMFVGHHRERFRRLARLIGINWLEK
ncbi:MAG TPA: hypothetical protein VL282_06925 [Tepidisphaeraceae bacterium]|nr:hypothetical protein [Tepidisphaeraceae bacterium]